MKDTTGYIFLFIFVEKFVYGELIGDVTILARSFAISLVLESYTATSTASYCFDANMVFLVCVA